MYNCGNICGVRLTDRTLVTDHMSDPASMLFCFYPRGASDARVIAIIVCLCVCVSHAGIVSNWLNVGLRKPHHVIAQEL